MKRIVVIGSALSGNKGAAAMLESSIQTLGTRVKDAQFTLLSMYPTADQKLNTYKNLRILNAKPLMLGLVINPLALLWRLLPFARDFIEAKSPQVKTLVEADVLLDQGGITFVDGREKFLLYNVASVLPAVMTKTKVVKCAQALGPFKNPINRFAAKLILPRMALIVARGRVTREHLDTLKLANVVDGADYAFSLELTKAEQDAVKELLEPYFFKGYKIVGVSPSVVLQKKVEAAGGDYIRLMSDFIGWLTGQEYQVMLVPHSARTTDKTHNNDLPLCQAIYAQIATKDAVLFVDRELPSQQLRALIGECDLFVASRFHAMVSALAMEVPTLVIGWSHKYQEVLEMFDLEKWAFGHDKLKPAYLVKRFEALEHDQDKVRARLAKHLPAVKQLSLQQADAIAKLIA